MLKETNGADWRREHVETTQFYTNKDIDKLISETEQTFTVFLESGDRQKAMKRLRVPPLGDRSDPWLTFKVGLFSGLFIVLFVAVLLASKILRHLIFLFSRFPIGYIYSSTDCSSSFNLLFLRLIHYYGFC